MENLRKEIQKKLKERYPHNPIVDDGILVDEIYKQQKVKVMFLLKETYGGYLKIINKQKIYNGKSVPFWPNIFNWTKLVNDLKANKEPKFIPKALIRNYNEYIDNIAYVNIKKIEGLKKSNYKDIMNYAIKDSDILKLQIDKINPDIIFTSDLNFYKAIFGLKNLNEYNLKKYQSESNKKLKLLSIEHNNRKIIKVYHPSYFGINQEKTFETILNFLKK